jgi:hypothetical protein
MKLLVKFHQEKKRHIKIVTMSDLNLGILRHNSQNKLQSKLG